MFADFPYKNQQQKHLGRPQKDTIRNHHSHLRKRGNHSALRKSLIRECVFEVLVAERVTDPRQNKEAGMETGTRDSSFSACLVLRQERRNKDRKVTDKILTLDLYF